MIERGSNALRQAYKEIPLSIAEKVIFLPYAIGAGTLAVNTSIYLGSEGYQELFTRHPFIAAAIGGTAGFLSNNADKKSTVRFFNVKEKAEAYGIKSKVREIHPLLSHIQTSEDFKKSKIRKAMDIGFVSACTIFPAIVAPPSVLTKSIITYTNRRIIRRHERAITIAQSSR